MPRYVVERTFADRLELRADAAEWCGDVVRRNADQGVTWLHSYVSDDGSRTFCLYEGPSPEAIRKAALANRMPVDRITQVRVLDPYFSV
jgi:Nickel responsive protein SCO4226-like